MENTPPKTVEAMLQKYLAYRKKDPNYEMFLRDATANGYSRQSQLDARLSKLKPMTDEFIDELYQMVGEHEELNRNPSYWDKIIPLRAGLRLIERHRIIGEFVLSRTRTSPSSPSISGPTTDGSKKWNLF